LHRAQISKALDKSIETFSDETKLIIQHSAFTEDQKEQLERLMAQTYYVFSDLRKAIEVLAK